MKKHTQIVLLQDGDAAVAVAPAYQGRVMTSTFDRKAGPSFGWINRSVIRKGLLSDEEKKGKLEEHIYIFGGEERFWLGPEGGQYALFFKPTSSPAAALKPGETMKHVQRTFHIQGAEEELNPLAKRLLGVHLDDIKAAF